MKWFFKIFFKTIRLIVGPIILLWDKITTPKGVQRSPADQQLIDENTKNLFLYQFKTCPFCIKVRRQIKRQSLNIQVLDAQHDQQFRDELLSGGGQIKVPCLKIINDSGDIRWMYESNDIIDYLKENYV